MKLKTIGEVINDLNGGKAIKDISGFSKLSENLQKSVLAKSGLKTKDIVDQLVEAGHSKEAAESLANAAASVSNVGSAAANATSKASTFESILTGLGTAAKTAAPYIAVFGPIVAAFAYAIKKAGEYQEKFNAAQSSQSTYESTKNELESVNTELTSTQSRLSELQKLSKSGKITLSEEAELNSLQRTNDELTRKKSLLQAQEKANKRQTVNDAYDTLSSKTKLVSTGDYSAGSVHDTLSWTSPVQEAKGNIQKLREYASEISDYQDQIAEAQNKGADTSKLEKSLDKVQSEYDDLFSETSTDISEYQSLADNLSQGVGESWFDSSKKKTLEDVNSLLSVWDTFANGYTGTEADLNNIEGFFKSNTMGDTLKDYVADLVKNGMSAKDALSSLGYSLSDLNLDDDSSLERYFDDIIKASKKASKSTKSFEDLTSSVGSIQTAIDSANAGANYTNFREYLSSAKEWYKQGLTGTDEFEEIAKYISPDGTSVKKSKANFNAYADNISKYFTADDDGNETSTGVKQFVEDLNNTGKQFKDTASAANALGISTQAFEDILGRVSDYDLNGNLKVLNPDTITRSADAYNAASTSLDSLRSVYDQMESGDTKDALGKKIKGWDKELAAANNDLSKLDPNIVLQITAEYNTAQMQADLESAKQKLELDGGTIEENRDANLAAYGLNRNWEDQTGLSKEGVKLPVEYEITEQTANAISKDMAKAYEAGDVEAYRSLTKKYQKIQDVQNELNEGFANSEFAIDVDDSSPKEVEEAWSKFMASADGQKILAKFGIDFSGADKDPKSVLEKALKDLGIDDETIQIVLDALDQTKSGTDSAKKNLDKIPKKVETVISTKQEDDNGEKHSGKVKYDPNTGDTTFSTNQKGSKHGLQKRQKKYSETLTPMDRLRNASPENNRFQTDFSADNTQKKNIEVDVDGTAQDAITQIATQLTDLPTDVVIELLGEGNASEEAIKTASEISGIPEEKLTKINAEDGAQGVLAAVLAQITGIPAEKWAYIFAQDNAEGVIGAVSSSLSGIDNKDVTISASDNASGTVNQVQGNTIKDKNFTITANDNASGVIASIRGALCGLKGKSIDIVTNYISKHIDGGSTVKSNGKGGGGGKFATGTAFAGGISKATGDWSVGRNEQALVNEVGPEIIARKGRWFIHNGGKPGFVNLQKDDIVFNAAQTRDLLSSGKASSYGKFIGASHANGTAGGMSFASGSGEDKVLSNFQEWFGKFFDWIEIRLDRVERKIDNVITKAESAMNQQRWGRSENLYRKGISYTIGQIGRETTVQGRYKDKANTVLNHAVSKGLINNKQAKAIRKQVKDGSLNIKSYGDRMQEVIKDYKEFYDKSLDASDAIQELKDKVLDYVDALEDLHEAQMQAKLDIADSLDDINTSTQNYTAAAKAAQLRYSNDNLERQNDAYKTRVEQTRKDYGRAQNSAENAAKQQSKAKRHKGTSKSEYKKYKKAVKSAQAAIKSGKEVSSSDLSVIENYAKKTTGKTSAKNANKLAAKIIKYNAERQALDEAKLARDVAKAENNADIISNIQDIYDAMDDEANDQIDLLESQADVATTLEEKNKLLKQASSLYDTMLKNDDAEIAEMASGVNSAAKKITKSTAYGKAINSADSATRKKVEALVQECKRRAAAGEDITDDMISQLAEYNSKGYVWRSFYNACLQYHQYYQAKLQAEAQKQIDEASFKAEKEALAYQAFQNIQESYERQQQQYDNEASIIDAQQSKNQALGYGDSAKYYTAKQKAQLAQNESMRQELNALQSSLSDLTVGSDEYYDALDAINDLTVSLIEGEAAVAEYQKSINQLNWDRFDELQDRISNLTSETDFLIDLLSYKDLQDKDTGNDTEYSKAVKALHVQNYQTYTQQAKDYAEAIKELDEQFADDSLNKDYLDRRQELVEAQQDAIISAQDEKEALIDLVQDGYDAQLDALDELISKYSDVLNSQKDIYDYQQNIKDITKDITTYQKQLQAYQYDDSEEAKQRIQQANQNLLDAQQDLSDAEYDQYISAAQELLSDLEDELSDHFDDIIDSLRDNADDLINSIDTSSADVSSTIKEATDSVGYTMSDAMTKIWGTDSEYGTISASVSAAVTGIKTLSSDINAAADKVAQAVLSQKSSSSDSDSSDVTGYASGGVVPNAKKILSRNGDTDFTINTLKAGERVLTPEQNHDFEKLVSFAPDLMDAITELPKVSIPVDLQNHVSQIDISSPINIEFTLPNVQNYSEFMNEMQKDKRVEKWLTSMLVNPLTGKSSMSKNNIRF